MISLTLIAAAAIFNALMDAFENENFYESIFKHWNAKFWYKRESWIYAKRLGGYKFDAWHIFKSLMVISLCLAVVLYQPVFKWWIDFLIAGAVWNVVFVLFYHKIFKIR